MDMDREPVQAAELDACNELYNVLTRLKRFSVLTAEEDRATRERIEAITETLSHKLPNEE
jgi:hypothetical protein